MTLHNVRHWELLWCAFVAFTAGIVAKQLAKRLNAQPSIRCPFCGIVSYHPQDIATRYCGACHAFHDDGGPSCQTGVGASGEVSTPGTAGRESENMVALKAAWEIRAGVIPGQAMPEYTKRFVYTSQDDATDREHFKDPAYQTIYNLRQMEAYSYHWQMSNRNLNNWTELVFIWY
jgi:hypothetical protein